MPELETFIDPEMAISFSHPAKWSVTKPSDPQIKTGVRIQDSAGKEVAALNFNTVFDFQPCAVPKPYQLLDSMPVNIPGMDTSAAPTTIKTEVVNVGSDSTYYPDRKPLRLGISLYSGPGQPVGTTEVCNLAAFFQADGKFGFFSADIGFDTVQEATAFTATTECGEIKEMLGSLRFL
ncbi:hypothetical protein [Paenarthrobacter sp. NPDC089316]|uniref:hypothetical protein n=1 Tax=unclassified Paenarthrobacter TaxID=2634190 RepID=UPI00343DF536